MAPVVSDHREQIRHLAAKRGVCNLRVFGSAARSDWTAESDIDLLVDLEPGRTLLDLGALLLDLQDLLHRKVDLVTPNALHWYVRDRILGEAVPL